MKEFSTELKVGFFALIVLAILTFMTFKVGGLEWAKAKGYTLHAYFSNTAGLDEKTRVRIAGVDAGIVDSVRLSDGRAKVTLIMDPEVKIYRNATASIKASGLLGDKYLAISTGTPDAGLLKDGDTINNVAELVDFDALAKNLSAVSEKFTILAKSVNDVIGTDEAKDSLRQTIVNLREITSDLRQTISVNDYKLRNALDNISDLTASMSSLIEDNREPITSTIANMKEFTGTLKTNGPELVENLNSATRELKAMVEENRPVVKSAVTSMDKIVKQIDRGEGSLGKFVKDDRLYESINQAAEGVNRTISAVDRFRTFLTFQAEYLTKPEDSKGAFYLTLQPRPDKYYILGVVSDPVGSIKTKETLTTPPGTLVTEETYKDRVEFTAQFAKRFGNAAVRIGLTENTFGIGGDYFFNDDRGRITADAWDFSNDERHSKNPHVKVGVEHFIFRKIFLSAGADNIFNSKWRGGYVGMGVRFEDEDIKYLFSTLPRIPTK
ncbi:MAG: MCE family protein [Nitrospirota bacterium]|nr:MCE family protein [Nitrospirota bacterium]